MAELTREECWQRLCEVRSPGQLVYAIPQWDAWLFVAGENGGFDFYLVGTDGLTRAYSDACYGGAAGCLRDGLIYAEGPGGTDDWDFAETWGRQILRFVRVRDGAYFRDGLDHPFPFPWQPEASTQ